MGDGGVVGALLMAASQPSADSGSMVNAWANVITAVGVVLGALPLLIFTLRTARSTHRIVNQEKTDRDQFNRDLIAALRAHGVEVPIDQSLPKEK
jgi:hypothetical protein